MEKVNIKFHDNYTVTYQHKKILQFVPELSVDKNLKVLTPNIPLLVISIKKMKKKKPKLFHDFHFSDNIRFLLIFFFSRHYHRKAINLVPLWVVVYRLH